MPKLVASLLVLLAGCAQSPEPAAPPSCPAQDARDDGTDCTDVVGYAFDGTRCVAVTCGCAGGDCDAIAASRVACEARFASCLADR